MLDLLKGHMHRKQLKHHHKWYYLLRDENPRTSMNKMSAMPRTYAKGGKEKKMLRLEQR